MMKKKKIMKNTSAVLLGALLASGIASCDKKSAAPPEKMESGQAASISLIPDDPAPGTMLRAVVSIGGEGLALRWERNGEALEVRADTLDTTGFKKGDRIRLVAGQGGPGETVETVLINTRPVVRSVSFKPGALSRGVDITAEVEGWDVDGDPLSYEYQWSVNGDEIYSETGQTLHGDKFQRGDEVSLRVVPDDGEAEGASFDAVAGQIRNSPPRFTSTPPAEFSGTFVYKPTVTDPDRDVVTFSILKGPQGMKESGGTIEWNAKGQSGAFEVTLSADDGNGGQSMQTFELKVSE